MQERSLLVLSDSRDKRQNGETCKPSARSFPGFLSPRTANDFRSKRKAVLRMLKGGPPRLYDHEQNGGFRDQRECNQILIEGPDFREAHEGAPVYLPACERYRGRFFRKLSQENRSFWGGLRNEPVEVVFVSGLYGLVLWDEPIQEYDCHFGDYAEGDASQTVALCWSGIVTAALCEFVNREKTAGRGCFRRVYDLLSEESYQLVLDWERIASCGTQVFHRIFKESAGPDILAKFATIIGKHLQMFSPGPVGFDRYQWYGVPGVAEDFGFEAKLFENPDAAREGPARRARKNLLEQHPGLRLLPTRMLGGFLLAESSWRQVQELEEFDFGAIIVAYSRAVESFLKWLCPEFKGLSLREMADRVSERASGESCANKLRKLATVRNAAAHSDVHLTKSDVCQARKLALEATEELLRLRRR